MKRFFLFGLRGYLLSVGAWSLRVRDGEHNHEISQCFQGNKYVKRLKLEENRHVHEITTSMVLPRNILTKLKKRNGKSATTIKHIYNECHRYKQSIRFSRSEMQHLFKCLVGDKYVYNNRLVGDSETVKDILWVHPNSIKFFNNFFVVLVMDSTYKTNKYHMLLVSWCQFY